MARGNAVHSSRSPAFMKTGAVDHTEWMIRQGPEDPLADSSRKGYALIDLNQSQTPVFSGFFFCTIVHSGIPLMPAEERRLHLRFHDHRRRIARTATNGVAHDSAEQTIGTQLRGLMSKPESLLQLSRKLRCSIKTVEELMGYWLPYGPYHLRNQMLDVFANNLQIDADLLRSAIDGGRVTEEAGQPAESKQVRIIPPVSSHVVSPSVTLSNPPSVVRSGARPPTIVWRKVRRAAVPS